MGGGGASQGGIPKSERQKTAQTPEGSSVLHTGGNLTVPTAVPLGHVEFATNLQLLAGLV